MGQICEKKKGAPFRHHPWIAFDMNLESRQIANKAIESHLVACVLMVSLVSSKLSAKKLRLSLSKEMLFLGLYFSTGSHRFEKEMPLAG